uniref:Uncharacterized protein n=1 Tax=Haemonchus contortus TaxID=6289 RepID=A0A7I5E561_HAECO|nr:hypothetical protein HCOI_01443600 [Haemonchus contortus]
MDASDEDSPDERIRSGKKKSDSKGNFSCCIHGTPCRKSSQSKPENQNQQQNNESSSADDDLSNVQDHKPDSQSARDRLKFPEAQMWKISERQRCSKERSTNNPFYHYIGIMTAAEAEKIVTKPTVFRLYHRTALSLEETRDALRKNSPEAVAPTIQLFVIYRSRRGVCRHYRIKENDTIPIPTYTVDIPNSSQPCFFTISGLVQFYSHFSVSNNYNENGELEIDVFPC